MNDKPRVSVICITYGQEDYIAQALDSFIAQKTNFKFQILVGEDKGPDRTAEIVLDYAKRYPDLIIPFIREENMGAQRNLIDLCRRAGTEYVAFCEGDDYWTDENKLQKQFDLMEQHKEYRACFHNTRIQADPSWYLYNWYIKDENGDIYIPSSIPGYDNSLREMRMDYYIQYGPAHTSSIFYRWDNSKEIPEWYYRHIYGDHSLMMIQAGNGIIGYIPETMSVYRRSDVGVLMYGSKTEHFLKSRASWIEMAVDIERYFKEHYNLFANQEIRERIIKEFNNYIRYIMNIGDEDLAKNAYERFFYPASLASAKANYVNRQMTKLEEAFSAEGIETLARDKQIQKLINEKLNEKKLKKKKRLENKIFGFTEYAKHPKDKSVWLFSCEGKNSFCGNTRHLYEYIIAYHPEIKPVWVTRSKNLMKLAVAENLPMLQSGSAECTEVIKSASVAFVNYSRRQSYDALGFNSGIRVVRLGSGASLFKLSNFQGYTNNPALDPRATITEILKTEQDYYSGIEITDSLCEYLSEDYKSTFLQLAANKRIAAEYTSWMGIPSDRILVCGSPQTFAVVNKRYQKGKKVLYAPAKRSSLIDEEKLFIYFIENIDSISTQLKEMDFTLDVFLPGNVEKELRLLIKSRADISENINLLITRDIFEQLRTYDAMISDYADCMLEFCLYDKPLVLLTPDKDNYIRSHDAVFDFDETAPGVQVSSWADAIYEIGLRLNDPLIDSDKREHTRKTVYDMTANDKNNSERIINEVKKRIGLE